MYQHYTLQFVSVHVFKEGRLPETKQHVVSVTVWLGLTGLYILRPVYTSTTSIHRVQKLDPTSGEFNATSKLNFLLAF